MALTETDNSPHGLAQANAGFALDLHRRLAREGNLFYSPLSVSTVLSAALAGARGETAEQMAVALQLPSSTEELRAAFASLNTRFDELDAVPGVTLCLANALWPQAGRELLQAFEVVARDAYRASVRSVDYARPEEAREVINRWGAEKTRRMIGELVPPGALNEMTRLVLTSAVYFKGAWAEPFNERLTSDKPFWLNRREHVLVPMMAHEGYFPYARVKGLQILELPYAGEYLSMVVFLPRAVDGLSRLERAASMTRMRKWLTGLAPEDVTISLPRFQIRRV
jgi:serpin B